MARAAAVLRKGGVVAFPTETVYGLGVRTADRAARARLFRIKGREAGKPFQLLVNSRRQALRLCGRLPTSARKAARAFWPGPLTLVVKARTGRWVGLRMPDHPVARDLVRRAGGALVATSANLSGRKPACSAAEAVSALGDRVDLVLDGGTARHREPSTVLRCEGGNWTILREGAIKRRAILRLLEPGGANLTGTALRRVRVTKKPVGRIRHSEIVASPSS